MGPGDQFAGSLEMSHVDRERTAYATGAAKSSW